MFPSHAQQSPSALTTTRHHSVPPLHHHHHPSSFFGMPSSSALSSAFPPANANAVFLAHCCPVQPVQKKRSSDIGGTAAAAAFKNVATIMEKGGGTVAPMGQCICDRDKALVVCRRCGHDLIGRMQRCCPQHPKRIALMDLHECPNAACRSVHLSEVDIVGMGK